MEKTKIDWADSSWNPVTGCYHGCEYCYARRMAERFSKSRLDFDYGDIIHVLDNPVRPNGIIGTADPYPYGFQPTFHRYRLNEYAKKKGRTIFVCSMADLFGNWIPDIWIKEVFESCLAAPQHRYLFLTKNPGRYLNMARKGILPKEDNFWYGSTVTRPGDRAFWTRKEAGYHTFASIEPILAEIHLPDETKCRPEWVIIGAETGNRKDRVYPETKWVDDLVLECADAGIPVFMKESLRELCAQNFIQQFPWTHAE